MTDPDKTETQAAPVQRIRDPQYREFYANATLNSISPYDLTITFQKTTEISPGLFAIVDLAQLILSPQHFKAFARSVAETFKAYENVFGEINIPEQNTEPSKTAGEIEAMLIAAQAAHKKPTVTIFSTAPPPREPQSRDAARKKERKP